MRNTKNDLKSIGMKRLGKDQLKKTKGGIDPGGILGLNRAKKKLSGSRGFSDGPSGGLYFS